MYTNHWSPLSLTFTQTTIFCRKLTTPIALRLRPNWNKFCSKKCRNNRSLSKIYLWHFSDWHFWGMTQSGNQKTITNVVSLLPYWLMNWTDWMQLVNHQHFLWSNTISHYKSIFTTSTFIYTNNVIIFNKNCIKMKIN